MNHYLVALTIKGARQVRIDEDGNVGIEVLAEDDEAFIQAINDAEIMNGTLEAEALH
jgi:hypothetical protein